MKNPRSIAPLTLALVIFGCGGDSEGGSVGALSMGISSGKPLSAVTTEEASSGCAKIKDALEAHFHQPSAETGLCTALGLAVGSTEAACAGMRDSCLQSAGEGDAASGVSLDALDPAHDFECSGTNIDSWQGCAASVGELEACFNDVLDTLDALLNGYTCSDASPTQVDPSVEMAPPRIGGFCSSPPLDASGAVAIDPATGHPYIDHGAECAAAAKRRTTPPIPASCQALQTKCPNLGQFGD